MAGEPLRAAVIGVGYLGRHHARILSRLPDVELVAVVDTDAERARAVAEKAGTTPETDPGAVLDRVEAVVLAVPTRRHREIALPFLERGVAVLVEKPIAGSLAEAAEMMDAARRSGATFAVGHTERYNPAVRVAMPLVSTPRFIEVHRLGSFPGRSLDVDVVFDVMIHDLDVILAAVQSDPVAIEAVGVPVLTGRVDIANARVRFADGCIANLTASRISRDRVRKVRFFQPDAYISIDCAAQEVEAWRVRRDAGREPAIEGGKLPVTRAEPLELELIDFVRAARTRTRPGVNGEDGTRALALAQQVAEAMKT
jgi:predicted dehydrogenase